MALSPLRAGRARRTAVALLAAGVFAFSAVLGYAEDGNRVSVDGAPSPVEQFSRQLEDFQKSVPDLNKTIQESAGAIDSVTDIDKARADIDKLREQVSTLLGAVSDNGPVSQLGIKALDHIHAKLKTLMQEQRFRPEERQFLIDQWQRLQSQTEDATKELDDARAQFATFCRCCSRTKISSTSLSRFGRRKRRSMSFVA